MRKTVPCTYKINWYFTPSTDSGSESKNLGKSLLHVHESTDRIMAESPGALLIETFSVDPYKDNGHI